MLYSPRSSGEKLSHGAANIEHIPQFIDPDMGTRLLAALPTSMTRSVIQEAPWTSRA